MKDKFRALGPSPNQVGAATKVGVGLFQARGCEVVPREPGPDCDRKRLCAGTGGE